MIEPTQVWTKKEWEALDWQSMPRTPLRTLLKREAFARVYGSKFWEHWGFGDGGI